MSTVSKAQWKPRPAHRYGPISRHDYYAGYSDGYYCYHFGAGHAEPNGPYREGYADGKADAGLPA